MMVAAITGGRTGQFWHPKTFYAGALIFLWGHLGAVSWDVVGLAGVSDESVLRQADGQPLALRSRH